MDKNTYETYEYLPSNTSEAEPDHFFVVQDDGTFLLNREVQYVAQVQDVKEVLEEVQPCTMYGVGVTTEQFYVDNSTELISVSDQFVLPHGENNLYASGYLLQPTSGETIDQMQNVDNQFKQPKVLEPVTEVGPSTTPSNNPTNNLTEITLSDDQYQMLEHRGWILFEANNKIFVLNTLGLHDITNNDKLIQKLRNEIQNENNTEIDSGNNKIQNIKQELPSLVAQSFNNQQDTVEFVIGSNEEQDIENMQFIITDKADTNELKIMNEEQMETCENNQDTLKSNIINKIATVKQEHLDDSGSLIIKTKYNFKDIPDKIVLGRTVNGKRLIAKVVNTVTNRKRQNIVEKAVSKNVVDNQQDSNMGISEGELLSLIQQSMRSESQGKIEAEDVKSTENVIAPLLKVPNLKNSLIGHNVIITKVRNNKDDCGEILNSGKVTLLTGRVMEKDDSSASFEFMPELLQNIKMNSEEPMNDENQHIECIDHEKEICTIFHVHITETKGADKIVRVSVALNKRQLSTIQMFDLKKRHPNTVFACSACASLFKSEAALKEHQENDCLDADEMLAIDTDETQSDMVDAYSIIDTENEKCFTCRQCDAKFPKLYTCVRHVKTHLGMHQQKSNSTSKDQKTMEKQNEDKTEKKINKDIYKCKMCSSTYFHPATLTKHIVSRHIKVKSK